MRNGKKYTTLELTKEEREIRESLPVDNRRHLIPKNTPTKQIGKLIGHVCDVHLQRIIEKPGRLQQYPHMRPLMTALTCERIKLTHKQQTFYHSHIPLSTKTDAIGYRAPRRPQDDPCIVVFELKSTTQTLGEHDARYNHKRGNMGNDLLDDTDFNMDALQVGFGVLCVRKMLHEMHVPIPVIGMIAKMCRNSVVQIYEIPGNHITTSPIAFTPLPSPVPYTSVPQSEISFLPWPNTSKFNNTLRSKGYTSIERKYGHATVAIKSEKAIAIIGVMAPRASTTLCGVRFQRHRTHIAEKRHAIYKKNKKKGIVVQGFLVYLLDNTQVVFHNVLGRH